MYSADFSFGAIVQLASIARSGSPLLTEMRLHAH